MSVRSRFFLALAALPLALIATPLAAGVGDLLVAPTRIILDGRRGTEIILNNIGDDVATYRVSVELRRMKPDGTLEAVTDAQCARKRRRGDDPLRPAQGHACRPTSRSRSASTRARRKASPTANIASICCSAPFPTRAR